MLMGLCIGLVTSFIFHILTNETGKEKDEVHLSIINLFTMNIQIEIIANKLNDNDIRILIQRRIMIFKQRLI